jgi:nicotinamidase-related amidase
VWRGGGRPAAVRLEQVLDNLNLAIAKARQRGFPIVFVQHEEAGLERDSAAWQLHPALPATAGDHFIFKRMATAFATRRWQPCWRIWASANCGWAAAPPTSAWIAPYAMRYRGFQVTVIADAHTTLSAFALSGEQVIDHFNAVWDATNATPQPLLVQPAAAL